MSRQHSEAGINRLHENAFIGDRLRAARFENRLTQAEVGRRLGVSFQQIQKYEKGENTISGTKLVALASALNKPLTYFLPGGDDTPTQAGSSALSRLLECKEGYELALHFPQLRAEQRRAILDLVRTLPKEPI